MLSKGNRQAIITHAGDPKDPGTFSAKNWRLVSHKVSELQIDFSTSR